jgi:hypothetical protein
MGDYWHQVHTPNPKLRGGLKGSRKINSRFGTSAGRADAKRRNGGDVGVHRRGAATKQMAARFLCGLSSPALTKTKLSRHELFGIFENRRFAEVLARYLPPKK